MRATPFAALAAVTVSVALGGAGVVPAAAAIRPAAAAAPVPAAASVPAVPTAVKGATRSIVGYARAGSGAWLVGSPAGFPWQRSQVKVPGAGTPVWGDWDGDGLATPGRYASGTWSTAAQRVGPATLVPLRSYGGVVGDIPVVGDWDGDGRSDVGIFRAGMFRWALAKGGNAYVAFGARGDRPVVGDWNGDGRLDVGVVRGITWYLRLGAGASLPRGLSPSVRVLPGTTLPAPVRRAAGTAAVPVPAGARAPRPAGPVAFPATPESPDSPAPPAAAVTPPVPAGSTPSAAAAAQPLVVVRASATTTARTLALAYGVAGDIPVAGDWDGDGQWTPGVVRQRASWLLLRTWRSTRSVSTMAFALPADAVPLPAPAPRDAAPGRCLTTSPRYARGQALLAASVVAPVPLVRPTPPTGGAAPDTWSLVRGATRDAARFLVRDDLTTRMAGQRWKSYVDVLTLDNRYVEYAVRRPGNAAFAVALARATGAFDAPADPADAAPAAPAVDPAVADGYVDWWVRSVSCQHLSVTPGGWGNGVQTALWAFVTGTAAWYSWSRQPPQVRGYVAAMVAYEAQRVLLRPIEYWKDRSGAFVSPARAGDTSAENVSWDGMVLALAAAMMPTNSSAPRWRAALVQRGVASFSRPADLLLTTPVNGISPAAFLRGTNANDDATVINHDRLNPDYMAAIAQNWTSALALRAGGRPVPLALWTNGAATYTALRTVTFGADAFPAAPDPRGPVYQTDGSIYYPDGTSWGSARRGIWVATDAQAAALAVDPAAPGLLSSAQFLDLHVRTQRALQARFADGRSYDPVTPEDPYAGGREEYNAQQLGVAMWAKAVAGTAPQVNDASVYSSAEPPQ